MQSEDDDIPTLVTDEDITELLSIAARSLAKDLGDFSEAQLIELGDKLVDFAEIARREYALLTLIEDGKVEPFLQDGQLAFRPL